VAAPALVVVSGAPATGKSAVAEALRAGLALPLIAKDAIKERLGEALDVRGRDESRRLGAATFGVQFAIVHELLAAHVSVIAEGNFGAAWFEPLPPARIVQVHLTAAPDVLRERMLARADVRHPVHYDREAADEVYERAARGQWKPLEIGGSLLVVDTGSWPDVATVVADVAALLADCPSDDC
jgi:predicted kinase